MHEVFPSHCGGRKGKDEKKKIRKIATNYRELFSSLFENALQRAASEHPQATNLRR